MPAEHIVYAKLMSLSVFTCHLDANLLQKECTCESQYHCASHDAGFRKNFSLFLVRCAPC
jgi:hypothetical protein